MSVNIQEEEEETILTSALEPALECPVCRFVPDSVPIFQVSLR